MCYFNGANNIVDSLIYTVHICWLLSLTCPSTALCIVHPDEDQSVQLPPLVPASIWTRKDLKSFKEMVRKTPENVIKIGSLATATVSCERQGHGNDVWTLFHTVCETINKNKLYVN